MTIKLGSDNCDALAPHLSAKDAPSPVAFKPSTSVLFPETIMSAIFPHDENVSSAVASKNLDNKQLFNPVPPLGEYRNFLSFLEVTANFVFFISIIG